jgi:tetratricopeptide (TPR) repeat protein
MLLQLFVLGVSLVCAQQPSAPGSGDSARAVVRHALRAIEGDSAATLRLRWEARHRRAATDRAATLGLASLARYSYDYAAAERYYRELYTDASRVDEFTVHARIGEAHGLETRGLLDSADAQYTVARRAATAARDSGGAAQALLGLSFIRAGSVGPVAGLATLDSAARLIPSDALDLQAMHHWRRAVMLAVLARPEEAAREAATGAGLARRAGEPRLEARALRAAALAHQLRGDADSSLAVLHQVVLLQRRARDLSALAENLLRIGSLLIDRGDYGDAKALLEEALTEGTASGNLSAVAASELNLGALAGRLNDNAAAVEHVRRALTLFDSSGDPEGSRLAREQLASVWVAAGDLPEARRQAEESLRRIRETGDPRREFEMLHALAGIEMRARDRAAARRELGAARTLARRHRRPEWVRELAFDDGRLALEEGDLTAAERSFDAYLRGLEPDQRLHQYEVRARLAEIYARRNELARAERELTSASDELDAWRSTLADRELRLLAFQATAAEESDQAAGMARVLAALAVGGRAEAAFALAEHRRARELADRLAQADALRTTGGAPRASSAQTHQRAVAAWAGDLEEALPDSAAALLEYVTGGGGAPTTLFVVTRAGVRAHVLPPVDSLAGRVARYVSLLEAGGDPRALARSLGADLLDAALASLPTSITRLLVVPDGPLHRVPFDALRLADGRYTVERYAVSVAPSAVVVAALRRRQHERGAVANRPVRVLAFGDPAFSGAPAADVGGGGEEYRQAFGEIGSLPRLPESGREARRVAAYAPDGVVRLRGDASAAYLKHAPLDSFRVLHLATHALVDGRTLARTAVVLSPGNGESGFVGPGDLAALELDADLVVLSACRTAGGVVLGGEGVQGLTAPLLQAGARAVVATGWRIGDRSAARTVEALYDALARGLPAAEALRAAKLDAMRRGAPASEWAAFTLVGDPLVTVPLRTPSPFGPWWLAVPVLVALAAPIYLLRGRWARVG